MSIKIIVDSGCDLTQEMAKEKDFTILPLKCRFGDEEFIDGITMTNHDFFTKLIETDLFPTTSCLSPYEYQKAYEEATADGSHVIVITLSARLSGCYQNAYLSAQEYDGRIHVVDSMNVCIGEGLVVEYALLLRDRFAKEGLSEEDAFQKMITLLEEKKTKIRLIALLDTLEYLKKGGRISAVTAMAGSLLSIKPVIAIQNGEVVALGQARGSKKGNNILNEFVTNEGIDFEMPLALAYSGLHDDMLQKYLQDSKHIYEEHISMSDIPVTTIGCSIGTHIGPGAIATSFFCK